MSGVVVCVALSFYSLVRPCSSWGDLDAPNIYFFGTNKTHWDDVGIGACFVIPKASCVRASLQTCNAFLNFFFSFWELSYTQTCLVLLYCVFGTVALPPNTPKPKPMLRK